VRPGNAACIVEADVQVEFATPKDAEAAAESLSRSMVDVDVEPEVDSVKLEAEATPAVAQSKEPVLFSGTGQRPNGEIVLPWSEDDIDGEMPWKSKRRIKGGVKWAKAPYGYDLARTTGISPADRATAAAEASAAAMVETSADAVVLGGYMSGLDVPHATLKAEGLEAAQRRQQQQAGEIAERRFVEEQAKRKQMLEEEEKQRLAAEEELKRQQAAEEEEKQRQAAEEEEMIPGELLSGNVVIQTTFYDGDLVVSSQQVRIYYV